ncbi:hypothetical protein FRX31_034054 [Thalictrum thalictroides]|uniref:RING-type domain-containing protein n=1 Tax=Thalictrum thalictroides TaxID=46969 RepID=A0A7J6UVZ3_THATH|nr:hypothetical protein FRX31_034054 [Thalictrum thalictroides]
MHAGGLLVSYVFPADPHLDLDDSFPTWLIVVFAVVFVVVAVVSIFLYLYKVYISIQSPARNPALISAIELISTHESILKRLPTIVFQSLEKTHVPFKTDECVICLGKYALNDTLLVLRPCRHSFHTDCIQQHFTRSTTCPVCRQPILLDSDDLDV